MLLVILSHIFYKVLGLESTFLANYFNKSGFWGKVVIILLINQFILIFIPNVGKDKKLCYSRKNFFSRFIGLLICGTLSYFVVIRHLLV